jgi:hypothetical protein
MTPVSMRLRGTPSDAAASAATEPGTFGPNLPPSAHTIMYTAPVTPSAFARLRSALRDAGCPGDAAESLGRIADRQAALERLEADLAQREVGVIFRFFFFVFFLKKFDALPSFDFSSSSSSSSLSQRDHAAAMHRDREEVHRLRAEAKERTSRAESRLAAREAAVRDAEAQLAVRDAELAEAERIAAARWDAADECLVEAGERMRHAEEKERKAELAMRKVLDRVRGLRVARTDPQI